MSEVNKNSATNVLSRDPQACPHLHDESTAGVTRCRLLGDLIHPNISDMSMVSEEICNACCRSFIPTNEDFNPVIASLVWSRIDSVLNDHAVNLDELQRQRLSEIQDFAENSIPVILEGEDDLPIPAVAYRLGKRQTVDAVKELLPNPFLLGKTIRDWAVGVTASPRRQPTILETISTLRDAGWDSPHLFIDGDLRLPDDLLELPLTVRNPAAGAWRNYYLAVVELLRRTWADTLVLVQDDCLWPSHLPVREYLEQIAWPEDGRFLVSLFCCTEYTGTENGWRRLEEDWKYGAQTFIFPRPAAEEFVSDAKVIGYGPAQKAGIDYIIGEWAARKNVPVFVPTPSLVQHIGDISTLWRTSRALGIRRASRYIGDELPPVIDKDVAK